MYSYRGMHVHVHAKSLQACPSAPGFSVHGILQARILEWVAMPSSRGSSQPRDQTHISYVSCIGRWVLHHHTTWEALHCGILFSNKRNGLLMHATSTHIKCIGRKPDTTVGTLCISLCVYETLEETNLKWQKVGNGYLELQVKVVWDRAH